MYLSFRIVARVGLCAFAAAIVPAAVAARPGVGGMRPTFVARGLRYPYHGISPTIVTPRTPAYAGYRGIAPTIMSRGRRGYGYGGYGGGGLGYDGDFSGDLGAVGYGGPTPGGFEATPVFALPAPPAPCPQIIEIGSGLLHKVRTHLVSGSPCRR